VFFGAVLVVVFVSLLGCFRAVFARFGGVLLFGLFLYRFSLVFQYFTIYYCLIYLHFFVFPPLADIFLHPLFLSRFCGIYFVDF
jgi:hypothetical protein